MLRISLILLMMALASAPLQANDEPSITHLTATVRNGGVDVAFLLEKAFDHPEVSKALLSGLPTGFTYHLEMIRKRPNWFDETVARTRIEVVCTYNSLTQEYLLNYRRDKRLVTSEVFSNLGSLRQRMTTIEEPELFRLDGRRPQKLRVRVRADVMRGFLLYVMPRDISTPWREARVKRTNANQKP